MSKKSFETCLQTENLFQNFYLEDGIRMEKNNPYSALTYTTERTYSTFPW